MLLKEKWPGTMKRPFLMKIMIDGRVPCLQWGCYQVQMSLATTMQGNIKGKMVDKLAILC